MCQEVPREAQGRVFAVRNALQFSVVSLGILLGDHLVDYVFQPFMKIKNFITTVLHTLVGECSGSNMEDMFWCTGILGSLALYWLKEYRLEEVKNLDIYRFSIYYIDNRYIEYLHKE